MTYIIKTFETSDYDNLGNKVFTNGNFYWIKAVLNPASLWGRTPDIDQAYKFDKKEEAERAIKDFFAVCDHKKHLKPEIVEIHA